jgi:hypothetical protein
MKPLCTINGHYFLKKNIKKETKQWLKKKKKASKETNEKPSSEERLRVSTLDGKIPLLLAWNEFSPRGQRWW